MSDMITIPAVLRKDQKRGVGLLKGYANEAAIAIDGRTIEAGHAVFLGFRDGEANAVDHLFYGNLCFEACEKESDAQRGDLGLLSQFMPGEQSREASAEALSVPLGGEPDRGTSSDLGETILSDDGDGDD